MGWFVVNIRFLQGTLPIEVVKGNDSSETKLLDKIVRICYALVNCCPGMVPVTS